MDDILIFIGIVIVIFVIITIIGYARDLIKEQFSTLLMFIVVVFGISIGAMMLNVIDLEQEKYENIMLDGNFEIRIKTDVVTNQAGDTLEIEESKYIHILKEE